jgi:hypothetical protein
LRFVVPVAFAIAENDGSGRLWAVGNTPRIDQIRGAGFAAWSDDGGVTWSTQSTGGTLRTIAALGEVVLIGGEGGLRRSADGGLAFAPVPGLPAPVLELLADPRVPARAWAGTADGVWRSDDAGLTWEPVTAPLPNDLVGALAVDAAGEGILAGTLGGSVHRFLPAGQ